MGAASDTLICGTHVLRSTCEARRRGVKAAAGNLYGCGCAGGWVPGGRSQLQAYPLDIDSKSNAIRERDFTVKLPGHFTFHFTVKLTVKCEN